MLPFCIFKLWSKYAILTNITNIPIKFNTREILKKRKETNFMKRTISFTLDKYSKVVLTSIAVCLVLIVVNLYFGPRTLHADQTVQDVNLKSINGSSISGYELPIDLKKISSNDNIEVDMKSVNGRNIFGDKMPVDIQSINGQFIIGGALPVTTR